MDIIRPDYPALPANPPASKGAVANVGADAGSQINPEWPATPMSPGASQGPVPNVGADSGDVVRGGHQGPTSTTPV